VAFYFGALFLSFLPSPSAFPYPHPIAFCRRGVFLFVLAFVICPRILKTLDQVPTPRHEMQQGQQILLLGVSMEKNRQLLYKGAE